jgi:hypothetical protein
MPSALAKPDTAVPAVLDIEASGFGQGSFPVEVGFVLSDGESFCCLIRPEPGWTHWDPEAEGLHQISRDTVRRHGRAVRDVAMLLNQRLDGLTLYCDGWAHDYVWLNVLFEAAGLSPSFRLDNLRVLMTDGEAEAFTATKREVAAEMRLARHRASSDAKVLQRTLVRLRAAGATR